MKETRSEVARRTAKGGIDAEDMVAAKFNNWLEDLDAQRWLRAMSYNLALIRSIEADTVGGLSEKADVEVRVAVRTGRKRKGRADGSETIENIQVKKVSNASGSNQMERRHVDKYIEPWHMPVGVARTLQYFTGDLAPCIDNPTDKRRMYMDEMSQNQRDELKAFLEENMVMIISDITRGRGRYAVEWMLVIREYKDGDGAIHYDDILLSINEVINYYVGDHSVDFPPSRKDGTRAGIRMGRVTIQRKGGDDPCCLQFKSDPSKLLELKKLFH